jgi:hypothetical protein
MSSPNQCPNCKHYKFIRRDKAYYKRGIVISIILLSPFILLSFTPLWVLSLGGFVLFGPVFLYQIYQYNFKKKFTGRCQQCNFLAYIN